jgi:hypothetical protein
MPLPDSSALRTSSVVHDGAHARPFTAPQHPSPRDCVALTPQSSHPAGVMSLDGHIQ